MAGTYDPNNPYQGADPYATQRTQATNAAQGAGQQSMDAISRRYAAMGNLNSGSYTSALQDAGDQTQKATEGAISGINSQENAANIQNQQFQQAQGQQAGEFGQQLAQQGSQFGQSQNQQLGEFQGSQAQQASQFGTSSELQQQSLNNDAAANAINASLGQYQQQHSGGLLGGGGMLGTGLFNGTGLGGTGLF